MRLAVLGGSFDPVHRGHEAMADAAQAALHPDLLLWVPARQAPHKPERVPAAAEDRLALLRLVVEPRPGEEIAMLELERPGPSYTVDTLRQLEERHPGAQLFLVLGADSLAHLHSWRDLPGIFSRAALALAPRTGVSEEDLARFRSGLDAHTAGLMRASFLPMASVTVSSTDIRRRLAAGESCRGLLAPKVGAEIRRRGLYCSKP